MGVLKEMFVAQIAKAAEELEGMPLNEKIEALNEARSILSQHSPFKAHPVDCVQWVKDETVEANDYNPNSVASPEMRLLELSIKEDGYTMPAVATKTPSGGYEIIDGFHRCKVAKKFKKPLHGYMPISVLNKPYEHRMASTIRHNRARGVHAVNPMSEIVAHLCQSGMSDEEISKQLGMDMDEVLRLKQCKGLPELFKDRDFSEGWE